MSIRHLLPLLCLCILLCGVSSVLHSIELPAKRGSSKCFFQTLLPGTDISMTFLPPIYTSTSPKQIISENLKSSTLTTTNYRILITGPDKSTVYSKDISNRPDDDRKGGDGFDSLSKLGTKNKKENREEATDSGDYEICFYDNSRYGVGGGKVAYNVVEYGVTEGDAGEDGSIKREHVDPLQDLLDEASKISSNIIKEMDYMHRREIRMHKTSESTNSRITAFAVLSVSTLAGVCFFQIVYLRGYFKRKKLL
ncbi:hypothetical protein TrLO_g11152 [Triparma laevis f. longispina]|uniref:GOLD domain-containing protein n=1 Tax=Triparma laevis f. longispina TaxID=1714387 RepID=A0A9W7AJA8_9STRA|nr:hypothetical protein TrLO_g11152 [Triparma laevis f. longispina]